MALWRAMRGQRSPGSPSVSASLRTLPRLAAAVASGRYSGTSGRQLLLIGLALVYVVSPVDVVPELALLGAGLLDDGVVLAWLAGALLAETDAFTAWERAGRPSGPAGGGASGGGRPGERGTTGPRGARRPDVVVGEVVD